MDDSWEAPGVVAADQAIEERPARGYEEVVDEWRLNLSRIVDAVLGPCGGEDHERVHRAFIECVLATEGPVLDALPPQVRMAVARVVAMEALHRAEPVNSVVRDRITRRQVRNWGEATRCVQYPGVREP